MSSPTSTSSSSSSSSLSLTSQSKSTYPQSPRRHAFHGRRPLAPPAYTPSGCKLDTNPLSLAPRSLAITHCTPSSACFCVSRGGEGQVVADYLVEWAVWRLDVLNSYNGGGKNMKPHPLQAVAWARFVCLSLGIGGLLGSTLDEMEAMYRMFEDQGRVEGVRWSDLFFAAPERV